MPGQNKGHPVVIGGAGGAGVVFADPAVEAPPSLAATAVPASGGIATESANCTCLTKQYLGDAACCPRYLHQRSGCRAECQHGRTVTPAMRQSRDPAPLQSSGWRWVPDRNHRSWRAENERCESRRRPERRLRQTAGNIRIIPVAVGCILGVDVGNRLLSLLDHPLP